MKKQTATNEWITPVKKYCFRVGITEAAVREIGEIVYVHLPEVGMQVTQGQDIVILESTKAAIDSYAPLSGTIAEVNSSLKENLQWLNKDPLGKGWLFILKTDNHCEWDVLNLR